MFIYDREACSRRPNIVKCPRHSTVGVMKSCLEGTQEIRLLIDDVRRVYGIKNGRFWGLCMKLQAMQCGNATQLETRKAPAMYDCRSYKIPHKTPFHSQAPSQCLEQNPACTMDSLSCVEGIDSTELDLCSNHLSLCSVSHTPYYYLVFPVSKKYISWKYTRK